MVYVTFNDFWSNLSKTSQLQTIIPAKVYEFVSSMYLLDYLSKNVGLTLIQVVMVRHSHDLSLLVRAVLLHMNSLPSQRRKYKTRAATVLCFGAAPLVYTITAIIYDITYKTAADWLKITYALNDVLPVLLFSLTHDTFIHVMTVTKDFLEGIAEDVQELINTPSWVASPGDTLSAPAATTTCSVCLARRLEGRMSSLARSLRALRVRYQVVHDSVHATNHIYELFNVVSSTLTMVQAVVCVYSVVITSNATSRWLWVGMWNLVWAMSLAAKLLFICIIGEQMQRENCRITTALQTTMAYHPNMDLQIKREICGFIQQAQLQEIRFKAVDPYYFDLSTMKQIIASTMAFIVILIQFPAMLSLLYK
ncbi:uncharacterized protein LOC113211420 [Frankliniella occidentalis]|uniref:Gustatory receptor n=1 Tax=Frankliniella occidentalis TaxID=133901 RepID=A0A6J1T1U8_FRAOC|nr:uncharacterized protein LOC113211420 [Frankliniella occidentalis]